MWWPFKKQPDEPRPIIKASDVSRALEEVMSRPVRPCWCGSVSFTTSESLSLHKWCNDCGAVYVGVGYVPNPCGGPDLRDPMDAALTPLQKSENAA